MVKKDNRENSGIGTISSQFITSLTQTHSLGLDASGNAFNKWTLLLTNNLLGIPLIYCICGDIDDGSTSKFGGTNGVHVDTLMNYVINGDGKSKATNYSQCSKLQIVLNTEIIIKKKSNTHEKEYIALYY